MRLDVFTMFTKQDLGGTLSLWLSLERAYNDDMTLLAKLYLEIYATMQ